MFDFKYNFTQIKCFLRTNGILLLLIAIAYIYLLATNVHAAAKDVRWGAAAAAATTTAGGSDARWSAGIPGEDHQQYRGRSGRADAQVTRTGKRTRRSKVTR